MWEILEKMSVRKERNLPMSMSFKMSYYKLLAEMCFMRISDLMRRQVEPASLHLKFYSMENR